MTAVLEREVAPETPEERQRQKFGWHPSYRTEGDIVEKPIPQSQLDEVWRALNEPIQITQAPEPEVPSMEQMREMIAAFQKAVDAITAQLEAISGVPGLMEAMLLDIVRSRTIERRPFQQEYLGQWTHDPRDYRDERGRDWYCMCSPSRGERLRYPFSRERIDESLRWPEPIRVHTWTPPVPPTPSKELAVIPVS